MIMLEDIPAKELSLEMMDYIKTYTCLEYPQENTQNDVDVFWSKCVDFINGN